MTKILFFAFSLLVYAFSFTQNYENVLNELGRKYQLSSEDLDNYVVSSSYFRPETNMHHVYLQQTVQNIPVFNAILQLHIFEGKDLKFHNSRFVPNAAERIEDLDSDWSVEQAFQLVLGEIGLSTDVCSEFRIIENHVYRLECPVFFAHQVRAKLVYYPSGEKLKLAYEFALEPRKADAWTYIISAVDGSILWKKNRTISCRFDHSNTGNSCSHNPETELINHQTKNIGEASYNAYPMFTESPIHGSRIILNNEEFALASPFGWHDTDGSPGAEHTITRGNNVYAHEDIANLDEPGYAPEGGADLVFDFPFLEGQDPMLSLDASITNLFVWNNFLHDLSYFYGFDEVSGNFQEVNYSGQGSGEDFVFAHAMDGSGTNNANFGTPEDGFNPVMQMYIWNHTIGALLEVTEPASIADMYVTGSTTFGVAPPQNPISAEVILVNDGSSSPSLGCDVLLNAAQISGRIAYFDRGGCTFVEKVMNAQNAGAIAVIIANNQQGGAFSMGGTDNGTVSIPAVSISQEDGVLMMGQLMIGTPVFANIGGSFELITHDSSFDNGIIAHEYGHGISNRLTGGSFQVNCLWNDEQMGEGWSDFFALIVSDTSGALAEMPRGIGNFASNNPANAFGIRPFPYTTDMIINPLTYSDINGLSIPHGVGSVWSTMLWDMYWAFVEEYGHSNDLYAAFGGNNMAIRLVVEGMRLQACNPGFVDGRDAILAADEFLYNGDNQCLIWKTFARRGLGFNASQGSSEFVGDEVESFDIPQFCSNPGVTIDENETLGFVIFPNPGTQQVQIKSLDNLPIHLIRVFDVSGNLIQSFEAEANQTFLNVANLSRGMYFIEIQGENGYEILRWLKN